MKLHWEKNNLSGRHKTIIIMKEYVNKFQIVNLCIDYKYLHLIIRIFVLVITNCTNTIMNKVQSIWIISEYQYWIFFLCDLYLYIYWTNTRSIKQKQRIYSVCFNLKTPTSKSKSYLICIWNYHYFIGRYIKFCR